MKILAIETSCDETGVSILEVKNNTFKVLANELASQIEIHKEYGGVFPALAKREHQKNLPILLEKVLKKTKLGEKKKPVDMIAVTVGPGLEPALWTGIVFAKEIGKLWDVPIQPVNHMEGHILSPFGKNKGTFKITKIAHPALSLLVSGGHTELVLIKENGKYQILGETLDDAAGEAFDKVARMMNLPYPGGPEISKLAEMLRNSSEQSSAQRDGASKAIFQQKNMRAESARIPQIVLPRPMIYSKNFNFSFSGLKTAVLYLIRDLQKEHPDILQNDVIKKMIALEFENAVVETLIHKTKKAIDKFKIKTLIVGGGVAMNTHLKRELKKQIKGVKILLPEKDLTTDNSIMIGIAGYTVYIKNKKKVPRPSSLKAIGNLRLK